MNIRLKGVKQGLQGSLNLPGDKSISHRAIIFGALAKGVTKINNILTGEDCVHTIKIFQHLGVDIQTKGNQVTVKGVGLTGLQKPNRALFVGNSGTGFRLLLGLLAGQKFITKINGDKSIQSRPMKRVLDPLKLMGAKFSGETAPVIVFPSSKGIRGIKYTLPIASAQVKSAILLAGLYAAGQTTIIEKIPARDHTERMLKKFGLNLKIKGNEIVLPATAPRELKATTIEVPGDISSAAFLIAAAVIIPGSKITLKNIGINKFRTGFLEALEQMGAKIELKNKKTVSEEPVADITVTSSRLKGATFGGEAIVKMIDELPVLAVVAAFAEGKTIIKNAEELRVKESDRIKTIVELLLAFEVKVTEQEDGFTIEGDPARKFNKNVLINSHNDHRIAMSAAIMALANQKITTVNGIKCIDTSFPNFFDYLKKLGAKI